MSDKGPPITASLTTDIGEGFGVWTIADDDALLQIVTGANIACGFHAGDPDIMRRTCEIAAQKCVSIGAQVSYRDLSGFGRRFIDVSRSSLANDLIYQIGALEGFARCAGSRVTYVRAHGALTNVAWINRDHARAVVDATLAFGPDMPLLAVPNTILWEEAQRAAVPLIAEAFIDRAYSGDDHILVSRRLPNALITEPKAVAQRAVQMVVDGTVTTMDGKEIPIVAQALLVHCDTPGAVDLATAARAALEAAGVTLGPVS